MEIKMKDVLNSAVETYGESNQMSKAQEECGELVAAISQYREGRKSKEQLAEEVADVEIMCYQMRIIFGDEVVDTEKAKKISRLAGRLGLKPNE